MLGSFGGERGELPRTLVTSAGQCTQWPAMWYKVIRGTQLSVVLKEGLSSQKACPALHKLEREDIR